MVPSNPRVTSTGLKCRTLGLQATCKIFFTFQANEYILSESRTNNNSLMTRDLPPYCLGYRSTRDEPLVFKQHVLPPAQKVCFPFHMEVSRYVGQSGGKVGRRRKRRLQRGSSGTRGLTRGSGGQERKGKERKGAAIGVSRARTQRFERVEAESVLVEFGISLRKRKFRVRKL
ncbi:unnamed protein product [Calypogeia fissa]